MRQLKSLLILLISVFFVTDITLAQVTDIDGNTYKTVQIGDQIWMAENLKVTKFNDGSPISLVSNREEWLKAIESEEPAYAYSDFNSSNEELGFIYNKFVIVGNKKLIPQSWKIPEIEDFRSLIDYVEKETDKELDKANEPQQGIQAYYKKKAPQCIYPSDEYEYVDYYDCVMTSKLRALSQWSYGEDEIYATNTTGFSALEAPTYYVSVEERREYDSDRGTWGEYEFYEVEERWYESSTGWWTTDEFFEGGDGADYNYHHAYPDMDWYDFGIPLKSDGYKGASSMTMVTHGLYIRLIKE